MNERFLVVPIKPEDDLIRYQIEMINYNNYPGIIPIQVSFYNQETRLHYDLDGFRKLSTHFEQKKLSSDELFNFLLSLIDLLQRSKDLLLNPACFLLEPSKIYYNPENGNPVLVYLPVQTNRTVGENLCGLLKGLESLYNDNGADIKVIGEILSNIDEGYISLPGLRNCLVKTKLELPLHKENLRQKPYRLVKDAPGSAEIACSGDSKPFRRHSRIIIYGLIQLLIAAILIFSSNYLQRMENVTLIFIGLALLLGLLNVVLLKNLFRTRESLNSIKKEGF